MALQHNPRAHAPLQSAYSNISLSPGVDSHEQKAEESHEHEMDSLPLRIFDEAASKFMCEKCTRVPLKVASCNMGHVFCRNCIVSLMNSSALCPADNTQITEPTLNNPILANIIKKENVCCLYGSRSAEADAEAGYNEGGVTKGADADDCPWTGSVVQLFDHLNVCKFKPMKCPFDDIGCKQQLKDTESKINEKDKIAHYQQYNVLHQDLILTQIKMMNAQIGSMQKEIHELRSLVVSPGSGGIIEQIAELKQMMLNVKVNPAASAVIVAAEEKKEGALHKAIMDAKNNVFIGVGCNEKGEFGKGDDDNLKSLQELKWSRGLALARIVSCSYKAFCYISSNMDVYVSGCNDFGQLGLNSEDDEWSAKVHPFFSNQNLKIIDVSRSINAFHVFFICGNNQIYCSGANEYGQLALGDQEQYTTPQKNEYFAKNNIQIKSIQCGEYHSLFLSTDGVVYSCGLNESFQLGYKTKDEFQKVPKKITALKTQIVSIAAGRDHSYCLDVNGNVWSFGSHYRGQLGIGKSDNDANDVIIHKIRWFEVQNKKIVAISSGNYHGAAIDKSGYVYAWGRGDEGQIGNGKKVDRFIPTQVDGFDEVNVLRIACGCHHTVALTQDNKVHCWGNNRYNQCADTYVDNFSGQHNFIRKPKQYYEIKAKSADKLAFVTAGSYHTLLLLNQP